MSKADELSDVCSKIKEGSVVMKSVRFLLVKWASNHTSVDNIISTELSNKNLPVRTKGLGLRWIPFEDYFSLDGLFVL